MTAAAALLRAGAGAKEQGRPEAALCATNSGGAGYIGMRTPTVMA